MAMIYCPITKAECKEPCVGSVCNRDFSSHALRVTANRRRLQTERAYRNRVNLLAFRLLERYDGLHSANCKAPKDYRRTLLTRLERILPLSSRKERVINGHVIIPEE